MDGKAEPIDNQSENIAPLTHSRILWLMALVTAVSTVLGVILESAIFGFGLFAGGVLSFLNYYWLKFSLKKVFDLAADGEKPGIFGAQYFLRYLAFGLLLTLIYLTKMVPIVAVIVGLTSFAFAVVIEGILRIFASFSNKKEI